MKGCFRGNPRPIFQDHGFLCSQNKGQGLIVQCMNNLRTTQQVAEEHLLPFSRILFPSHMKNIKNILLSLVLFTSTDPVNPHKDG